MNAIEHFNVILVGAGISGIGFGYHLKDQCPSKSFVILEEKETFGGTWHTHTYPGIRSDSDLYTFGYRFKPWTGAPIAEGQKILEYLGEVIDENELSKHIRYKQKIVKGSWSSDRKIWTIDVEQEDGKIVQYTCDFFVWTGGYYDHSKGYTPRWKGLSSFEGPVIHPQTWPKDVDITGKKVVVIGSGATAATLIPNIADDCSHVTMLQRSPTYFWTGENRNELADKLRELDIPEEWVHEIVRRDLLKTQKEIQHLSSLYPEEAKQEILNGVRKFVGDELVAKHFTPNYRPWQQRLAYVPDADLFKAVNSGKVSIVTDHIERITPKGIETQGGEFLDADVIITATGFNVLSSGGTGFDIDGVEIKPSETFTYRGIMLSDIPNFATMFGYLRTSWTMRVDLVADYVCRLLNHMDARNAKVVVPKLRPQDQGMKKNAWISEDEFNPGYLKRSADQLPRSGDHEPWVFSPDYYVEKEQLPQFDLDEDALVYG